MKKLMTMSFIILFSVLAVLSCINFSYNALETIENDKQTITIEKPGQWWCAPRKAISHNTAYRKNPPI